jgi:ornithine decarboxylase
MFAGGKSMRINGCCRGSLEGHVRVAEDASAERAVGQPETLDGVARDARGYAFGAMVSSQRIDAFLAQQRPATPCLVVDLDIIRRRYATLAAAFPQAEIYYAVKANPALEVISTLAMLGAHFDLASAGEIDRCIELGASSSRLSFGNTIKRETSIARAHELGVDLFGFDSLGELEKLARSAPGARVFCRILVRSRHAEWPLTRKFGCMPDMVIDLLCRAKSLGMRPVGVSFHVGSQQIDPRQWRGPIRSAARIFRHRARNGIRLDLLNVGGGLPAHYRDRAPALEAYAEVIDEALVRNFGSTRPRIIVEPGRYLVADAGTLRTEVLLIARKATNAAERWVYLDAGRYNGLTETLGERIRYHVRTPHDGKPTGPVVIAGPTCDSTDILYEHAKYELPLDLDIGDPVDFLSAGAYTASYASVEFNGFAPIQTYCV